MTTRRTFIQTAALTVEMDDFARCIMQVTATRAPGEEGLRDIGLMMSLYESARTGKPINLRTNTAAL